MVVRELKGDGCKVYGWAKETDENRHQRLENGRRTLEIISGGPVRKGRAVVASSGMGRRWSGRNAQQWNWKEN
ncbi:hypothetical protein HPP92_007019 [Vanilla planifolia]|uniref:Uncharacterized protein n=1 Tax=Vanilla planifolia TaxID=51239 RepID=A0A835V990_VANPL|nr:hypothetical protein HPP92_007259 [Vanilla planifolia]KAG0488455.1 hypothetical protein HPP92_007266 [Vanilla planifolia]KAG0490156.1 hypothetical protein HPP92_007019 [Vanilla planifolia]